MTSPKELFYFSMLWGSLAGSEEESEKISFNFLLFSHLIFKGNMYNICLERLFFSLCNILLIIWEFHVNAPRSHSIPSLPRFTPYPKKRREEKEREKGKTTKSNLCGPYTRLEHGPFPRGQPLKESGVLPHPRPWKGPCFL